MTALASHLSHAPTLCEEDPRSADAVALSDIMAEITFGLYPEDAENGIFPTTTEELVEQGVLVLARVDGEAAACGALMAHGQVDGFDALEVKRMLVLPQFPRPRTFPTGAHQARTDRATAQRAEAGPDVRGPRATRSAAAFTETQGLRPTQRLRQRLRTPVELFLREDPTEVDST